MLLTFYPLIFNDGRPRDYLVKLLNKAKFSGDPADLREFEIALLEVLFPIVQIIAHADYPGNPDATISRIFADIFGLNYFTNSFKTDLDLFRFIQNRLKI